MTAPSKEVRWLVLVGGGEHAGVVADAALAAGWRLRGYSELEPGALVENAFRLPYLGDDTRAAADHPDAAFVIAIGGQAARVRATALLEEKGVRFAAVIHPRATVAPSAEIAPGAVVLAGAVINHSARIAAHAIINTGAVVEHDVVVGRLAHISPAAAVGGASRIEARAVVGLGARVRDHVVVGEDAFVAMGAVVIASVPAGQTVMGVPARPRKVSHGAIA